MFFIGYWADTFSHNGFTAPTIKELWLEMLQQLPLGNCIKNNFLMQILQMFHTVYASRS